MSAIEAGSAQFGANKNDVASGSNNHGFNYYFQKAGEIIGNIDHIANGEFSMQQNVKPTKELYIFGFVIVFSILFGKKILSIFK